MNYMRMREYVTMYYNTVLHTLINIVTNVNK